MSNIPELHQNQELSVQTIQNLIVSLPNRPKAMLAKDLADIYQTEPKRINEAVKRNPKRFPADFVFQATKEEVEILRSQNATFKQFQGVITYLPYLFTREGANMLSAVLNSDIAVERSVQIVRAFSQMEDSKEQPKASLPKPIQDSEYVTTFANPTVVMMIRKKNIQDNAQWRFVDFDASLMFVVKADNTITMSEYQFTKAMDMIGWELKSTLAEGFNTPTSPAKRIEIQDVFKPDKFKELEESQKMLKIELAAATSQVEEIKALRVAEEAIRTKAQIGDKKVASAMGKAGALSKKNKKLQQENLRLKRLLLEKNIFDSK